MEHIQEKIQFCIRQGIPFVFYRMPQNSKIHFIAESGNDKVEYTLASGFMFNPFLKSERFPACFIKKGFYYAGEQKDFSTINFSTEDVCDNGSENYVVTKEEFCRQVENALKAIKKGELDKVILSRMEKVCIEEKNPVNIFIKLCSLYSHAFISLVVIPGNTVWLTASPELFMSLEGDTVQSVSLAGTKIVDSAIPWTEKEKIEQSMVTDYIYNVFANNCINVEVSGPREVVAGNIAHLKTEFKGKLNTGMYQLLDALHPTPAVCGLPRDEALDFIKATEMHQRKYYSGYLGPCNINGKTEWYVNLRCAELFAGGADLFAGCGITAGSIPEKEWNETILKAQTLLNVMSQNLKIV